MAWLSGFLIGGIAVGMVCRCLVSVLVVLRVIGMVRGLAVRKSLASAVEVLAFDVAHVADISKRFGYRLRLLLRGTPSTSRSVEDLRKVRANAVVLADRFTRIAEDINIYLNWLEGVPVDGDGQS